MYYYSVVAMEFPLRQKRNTEHEKETWKCTVICLSFLGGLQEKLQGPVSERRLSENSEYVNPEMRETLGFSVSKWEVCQTRESR